MRKIKRNPRKIGGDDEDEVHSGDTSIVENTIVKRPNVTKSKTTSALRRSFPLGDDEDERDGAPVVNKPRVGRQGLQRGVNPKTLAADRLPHRVEPPDDRPSYTAADLAELKNSTPTVPQEVASANTSDLVEGLSSPKLDIAAKFGTRFVTHLDDTSAIPTELEIQEKKERRRRLAKEQDFISLEDGNNADYDSDNEANAGSHSLIIPAEELSLKDKYGVTESRLAPDDEDMAEGFDSFVEDSGKVTLGETAALEQEKQRRLDIESQIYAAQFTRGSGMDADDDEDEVDEEEITRTAAYDAAQTKFGTYGTRNTASKSTRKTKESSLQRRLTNVPRISPLPEWKGVIARFQQLVQSKDEVLQRSLQMLENNRKEREAIAEEEGRIQALLEEAGQKFKVDKQKFEQNATVVSQGNITNGADTIVDQQKRAPGSPSDCTIAREADIGSEVTYSSLSSGVPDVNLRLRSTSGMAQMPRHNEYDSDE